MTAEEYEQFTEIMKELALAYRTPWKDETLRLYARALEDLPLVVIAKGLRVVIRTVKKFPSIAEIRAAATAERVAPGQQRGTYPPDVAALRRRYGLPVTPEEHLRYDAGETLDRPLQRATIVEWLRKVAPTVRSKVYREASLKLADEVERKAAITADAGPLTGIVKRALEREPGEEG